MNMKTINKESGIADPLADRQPGKRLDEIAMSLALIMTGGLWLAPEGMFPEGTWPAGLGVILLGLNAARRLWGVTTSGFGIIVGLFALAAGIGRIVGRELPLVPVFLIIAGLGLVIRAAALNKKPGGMRDAS
jgi:hypothetical protein